MIDLSTYLQLDTNDDMYYYILPSNFSIYRGDTSIDKKSFSFPNNTPFFFGTNVEEVEQYGIVFEFRTTREYKLIAIDNFQTQQRLYKNATPDIQQILKKNYGYSTSGIQTRDSVSAKDIAFSNYLCKQGYDGYAINDMDTDLDKFHQEIVICSPQTIQLVKQITTDPKEIQRFMDKKRMVDMGKTMDVKRKKRPTSTYSYEDENEDDTEYSNSIPMPKFNMDNMDDDEESAKYTFGSPPTTPIKKLSFGGKVKKTKRLKRKSRKQKTMKPKNSQKNKKTRKTRKHSKKYNK